MIIIDRGKCAPRTNGRRYLPAWDYEIRQTYGGVEYLINGEKVSLSKFMSYTQVRSKK